MKTLDNYTKIIATIAKLKEKNAKLFDQLQELEETKAILETNLKDEVKTSKKPQENAFCRVIFSERWNKWYEYESLSPKEKKQVKDLGIATVTLDSKKFEEEVKKGNISRETKAKAFKEKLQCETALIKLK